MKFVTYFKDTLKVNKIMDYEVKVFPDIIGVARCENIINAPQFGYLKVKNLETKIEEYTEIVEVIDEETQQPVIDEKTGEVKTVEEVKTREYLTCELEAIENPNKERIINLNKINELKKWFNNNYRMYNEMLTRRESLGIIKECKDGIRNKIYYNL